MRADLSYLIEFKDIKGPYITSFSSSEYPVISSLFILIIVNTEILGRRAASL